MTQHPPESNDIARLKERAQGPDAMVLFGTALALRFLTETSCARTLVVHDAASARLRPEDRKI